MGCDPYPLSLRELLWRAEGRTEFEEQRAWNHTAAILHMLYSINRGKGKRMGIDDFHPMRTDGKLTNVREELKQKLERIRKEREAAEREPVDDDQGEPVL